MRRALLALVPTAVAALLLAGCTGAAEDAATGASPAAAPASADERPPGSARAATSVMAEHTVETPHGGGDHRGGEVTVTLRAVEVSGGTMTVRWALRWDDDAAEADAGISYYDMGVQPVTTVTDGTSLRAYRPFCTEGSWQPGDEVGIAERAALQMRCEESMLVSPLEDIFFQFPNHGTVEGWSLLPAPEKRVETVDVLPLEGLPAFTGAEVAYPDGDA